MPHNAVNSTPWVIGGVPPYTGAFRDNVRAFLTAHGTAVEDVGQPSVSCWLVHLEGDHSTGRLYVYEEELDVERPAVCDACRIIGVAPCYPLLPTSDGPKLGTDKLTVCISCFSDVGTWHSWPLQGLLCTASVLGVAKLRLVCRGPQ